MKTQSAAVAMVVVSGMAIASGLMSGACSVTPDDPQGAAGTANSTGGTPSSTAGTTSSAGNGTGTSGSGTGTAGSATASCTNVTGCGGNVVGNWSVKSACLNVSGELDMGPIGVGCKSAPVTGSINVTGTFAVKADGTYVDNTTSSGEETFTLDPKCLEISGTITTCDGISGSLGALGYSSVTCTNLAAGGCTCKGTVQQMGSIGFATSDAQKNGNYTTASNELTTDGKVKYSYCVAGNQLTLSPVVAKPLSAGSIVLEGENGTGGTGAGGAGAGGSGGATQGGSSGSGGSGGGGNPGVRTDGPCDLYQAAGTPCVAAYSMIRGISKAYTGPLYQVRSGSSAMNTGTGGMTKDIGMTADGYADSAAQDAFCAGSVCTVSILYDQSGNSNNLTVAKKGLSAGGEYADDDDFESTATKGPVTAGGKKVYSLYMAAREGYRMTTKGKMVPVGTSPQGIYMLADGTHSGTACCWDFGNVTTNPTQYHTMNTLFFGKAFWGKGAGDGPWFMADFEAGVWAGGSKGGDPGWGALSEPAPANTANLSMKVPFALGFLKTSPSKYAIRFADSKTATDVSTAYEGAMPKSMDNQGAIVLGVGGDNSNNSWGTFFEGAVTAGYPTNAAETAILKNIQAVGYTK